MVGVADKLKRGYERLPKLPGIPHEKLPVRHSLRPSEVYEKVSLDDLLHVVGCERALRTWEELYKYNRLYNCSDQDDAPPIKRVVAISGCNVRTEVGCVFRVNTHRTSDVSNVRTLFVPDDEAELTPYTDLSKSCSLINGVIYEEPSPLSDTGDGTVPYSSLHHSASWKVSLEEYSEHFLKNSSHSTNLFDARVHKLVVQALTPGDTPGATTSGPVVPMALECTLYG